MKKFKDGKRLDSTDKICKRRHSLIYVTALQNVSMTVTPSFMEQLYISNDNRFLQTAVVNSTVALSPNNTGKVNMNIVISSEYFSSNAKLLMTSTLSLVAMVSLYFFWLWELEEELRWPKRFIITRQDNLKKMKTDDIHFKVNNQQRWINSPSL